MASRLGSAFPPAGVRWWGELMGRTAVSTEIGFMATIAFADIRADLPRIVCPTLVITTEDNADVPLEKTRAWQQTIPNSTTGESSSVLSAQITPVRDHQHRQIFRL
jgi:pimeloyl-ACP methyl ester carboxylesterase